MTEGSDDRSILDQENAGHAEYIAAGPPTAMTAPPGFPVALQNPQAQEFRDAGAAEAKRPVKIACGIAETRQILQAILPRHSRCLSLWVGMHERQLRSQRLDGLTLFGQVRHGFAAENSAKVAKENHQDRRLPRQFIDRGAVLVFGLADSLREIHGWGVRLVEKSPPASLQDDSERQPPDHVIGENGPAGGPGQ